MTLAVAGETDALAKAQQNLKSRISLSTTLPLSAWVRSPGAPVLENLHCFLIFCLTTSLGWDQGRLVYRHPPRRYWYSFARCLATRRPARRV